MPTRWRCHASDAGYGVELSPIDGSPPDIPVIDYHVHRAE